MVRGCHTTALANAAGTCLQRSNATFPGLIGKCWTTPVTDGEFSCGFHDIGGAELCAVERGEKHCTMTYAYRFHVGSEHAAVFDAVLRVHTQGGWAGYKWIGR